MQKGRLKGFVRFAVCFGLVAAGLLPSAGAIAQTAEIPKVITPPEVTQDPNGLNLVTGKVQTLRPSISIPAAPRLTYTRASDFLFYVVGQRTLPEKGGYYSLHVGGGQSESFRCEDADCTSLHSFSVFTPTINGPSTYTQEKSGSHFDFDVRELKSQVSGIEDTRYLASSVLYADGERIDLEYEDYDPLVDSSQRLMKATSNTGYFLEFEYWDSLPYDEGWALVRQVSIYAVAAPTTPLARLSYSSDGNQVTDLAGRIWTCDLDCGFFAENTPWRTGDSITLPGEGSAAVIATPLQFSGYNLVTNSITHDGVGWTYAYGGIAADIGPQSGKLYSYKYDTVTVTGPNGYQRVYELDTLDRGSRQTSAFGTLERYEIHFVKSSTDEFGKKTDYEYESYGGFTGPPKSWRLTAIDKPEGNRTEFVYGADGDIVMQTDIAKPGSGLGNQVQEAAYGGYCGGFCSRPVWYEDAKDVRTFFAYNSRGQLTKQVDPADAQGVRRITFHTYEEHQPAFGYLSRLVETRVCAGTGTNINATCSGGNLVRTEYDYWNDTLLPSEMRQIVGAETRTTTYTYDAAGRALAADGPLTGTNDKVYGRYDSAGRKTWEIGPLAPNGLRIATRTTLRDADDKPSYVETGTLTSSTDTNLQVFDRVDYTYDSRRNPIRAAHSSGGTTHTVTDSSFLDRGLTECTTVRMNLASIPATSLGACNLGTQGSQGPDRITKNLYDTRGQLVQVRMALGTSVEIADVTYSYTDNGLINYVVDANGNRAQLTYDGFDRQKRWIFPSSAAPPSGFNNSTPVLALSTAGSVNGAATGTSSGWDYEEYGYDANGNRTSLRKRDGTDIAYTYDNLNRMMVKDVDANSERTDLAAADRQDVYYTYDVNGVQTSARFGSTSGSGIVTTPDGFGQITSAQNTLISGNPAIAYLHDKAGNVTRITHPDTAQFDYAFDALGRIQTIKKGTTTLVAPSYLSRGLLDTIDRYDTALDQNFDYDAIGRLSALDIGTVTHSAKVGWDYTRNPASQIATELRDNDSFAWLGRVNSSVGYTANGLNQYSVISGDAHCYDANGNLTDDSEHVYKYDVENRLVEMRERSLAAGVCPSYTSGYTGTLLANLHYDPVGRLLEAIDVPNSSITRFLYDGDALVLEYNGSNAITQRYIHGNNATADDPLIWYEGSSAADSNVRNLYADPRGSIVLVMGSDGVTDAINTYDEWGVNSATNLGRFQYTGQAWLDEIGMYYYKARIYSPALGRFLQVDPIGYEDQVNLYAYVGNDPINAVDPTGEHCNPRATRCSGGAGFRARRIVTAGAPRPAQKVNIQRRASDVGTLSAVGQANADADGVRSKVDRRGVGRAFRGLGAAATAVDGVISIKEQVAEGKPVDEAVVNTAARIGSGAAIGAGVGTVAGGGPWGTVAGAAVGAAADKAGVTDAVGNAAEHAWRNTKEAANAGGRAALTPVFERVDEAKARARNPEAVEPW